MSDSQTAAPAVPTPTPTAGPPQVGLNAGNGGAAPTPQAQTTPAAEPAQPYRSFANQAELDAFVKSSKSQAERSAIRKLAKDLGFEDADEMRESLQTLRQAQGGASAPNQPENGQPAPAAQPSNDATASRLQMALRVGAKLNLPVALIERLQGSTEAEMEADAQTLVTLMGTGATPRPGIPPVPAGNQPATFTTTQLQDAEFVRNNAAAIQAAAREGRIVRS